MLTHRDPALVRRIIERVAAVTMSPWSCTTTHGDRTCHCPSPPRSSGSATRNRPAGAGSGLAHAVFRGPRHRAPGVPDLSWALVVSGQDYPCRPMGEIEAELRTTSQDAFLRWFRIGPEEEDVIAWQARCRARYLHSRRIPGQRAPCPVAAPAPVPGRAGPVRRGHVAEPVRGRPGPPASRSERRLPRSSAISRRVRCRTRRCCRRSAERPRRPAGLPRRPAVHPLGARRPPPGHA